MARRKVIRSLVAALAVVATATPIAIATNGTGPAGSPAADKVSPALRHLVEHGYGDDVDLASLVPGYVAGDVAYLASVTAVDRATRAALAAAGARVRHEFPEIGWVALDSAPEAVDDVAALDSVLRLRVDDLKEVLELDVRYVGAAEAVEYADQTKRGTHDVGADVLWAMGITGDGVRVGVADSGIDQTHPDLGPKLTEFVDCSFVLPNLAAEEEDGSAGACAPTPGYDDNGHGTHVSGIATGAGRELPGMAPTAELAGAKVCSAAGVCLNSSVMAGFRWLATDAPDGAGADVVNMSLGGGRAYGSPLFGAEQVTDADPEAQLVNALADRYNVVFTISAGNSGPVLQSVGSPSVASQAISVGASVTDFDLDHPVEETLHGEFGDVRPEAAAAGATAIASFSSRGPTGDRQIKPELTAPGSYYVAAQSAEGAEVGAADLAHNNHYSDDPTYAVLSGTSMSSPAAAGVAALLIDGFRAASGGASPQYYHVKAALSNTAQTEAFEGPVAGLLGTIQAKTGLPGQSPAELYPNRNDGYVGNTGEGAGRIHAPSALLALTHGVIAYVPRSADGKLDDRREQQPNWALDDVAPGQSRDATFMFHPAPGRTTNARASLAVDPDEPEAAGIHRLPAAWLAVPKQVVIKPGPDTGWKMQVRVPEGAAPGQYNGTVVARVDLGGGVTQNLRIPVQLFVPLPANASVEGPIFASESTDWSYVGAAHPLGDVFTDWVTFPLRLDAGTEQVDLAVYDTDDEDADHMDVFVFDETGVEIDSTVSSEDFHALPGGAVQPATTKDSPGEVSVLDDDGDLQDVALPATVWVVVADSGRTSGEPGLRTFHLDVTTTGGGTGGTTPADRIHSGEHAWWSGSASGMTSTLTRSLEVPADATQLSFWTWYQLEDGYDWAYVLVSDDGGATWTSLPASSPEDGSGTTDADPIGDTGGLLGGSKAHPDGFTGDSGAPALFNGQNLFGAVLSHQVADVSAYAGTTVQLRVAATSDPATNLDGFYVDDLALLDGSGRAVWSDPVDAPAGWTSAGSPGFVFVTREG